MRRVGVQMRYIFLLVAVTVLGCEPQPEGPIKPRTAMATLEVEAVDLAGAPVAGARFTLQGRSYNMTDAEGKFHGFIEVEQGDEITFDIAPPEGFSKGPTSASRQGWRRGIHLPKNDTPIQLKFKADFKRPRQDLVLLVNMKWPGESVLVNNKGVAQTGVNGIVTAKSSCNPGEKLLLRVAKLRWEGVCPTYDETYIITETYQGPISDIELKPEEDQLPKGSEGRELAKVLEALKAGEDLNGRNAVVLDRRELWAAVQGIKARVAEGKGISEEEAKFISTLKPYQIGYLDGVHTLATQKARDKQPKALIPQLKQLVRSSRFKEDGELWFMLARAYEQEGKRGDALMSLLRVEAAMRVFSDTQKQAVMELHTKLLEAEFKAQLEAKEKTANLHLLKMAKARYEQLKQLNPSDGSIGGKIKAIEAQLEVKEEAPPASEAPKAEGKSKAGEAKASAGSGG